MTRDINDYLNIFKRKNGGVKISHKEGNIYKLLRELGYGKTKLDNKIIYFYRDGNGINSVSLLLIKDAFKKMLESKSFLNIPTDIDYLHILEWYYGKRPIKENGLFNHYLADTLTEIEEHKLRLQTDTIYKERFEVQQLLLKFDEWGFSNTIDIAGGFGKYKEAHPLYYKNVSDKKFLVFNYSRPKNVFDCCIAAFENEKHIGNEKPLNRECIQLCFNLERDFKLISKYVK